MNCRQCGFELKEQKFCPMCGWKVEFPQQERPIEQVDVTKMAAQQEINKLKQQTSKGNIASGWCAIVLGILFMVVSAKTDQNFTVSMGGVVFLLMGVIVVASSASGKKRISYLENVANGRKEILLCPYCKGTNVNFSTVQKGSYTSGQTARISDNINPLHPFTHTNVRTSGTNTNVSYGSLYQCGSCGKTFENPERMWL